MEQTNTHKAMQMPLSEIRTEFVRAKDKKEQIKILSERNLCSREEIIQVLIEQGVPKEDIPGTRGRRKTAETAKEKKEPVPQAVREAVAYRMGHLTDKAARINAELKELNAFMENTKGEEAEG